MIRQFAFALSLLAMQLHVASYASTDRPINLAGAVNQAVEGNPQVRAAWHRFLAALDESDVARGGFLPDVDLTARIGRERQEFIDQNVELDFDPRGVNLTITQMLYDGFATRNELDRLNEESRVRYFELRSQIETTALETILAFNDVRRFRKLVILANDNINRHREVLDQITRRVDAGISRSVDLEQATARFALAEANLITELSNLHDVSARYQRIVGTAPAATLDEPQPLDNGLPGDLRHALYAAYSENPAVLAATASIQAAQESVGFNRSRHHPRIDLRLSGDYGDDIDRIQDRSSDLTAEVVLTYRLFNGLSDRAAIRQAADLLEVARDIHTRACRNVRQTLRIAHNDVQRIADQLRFLEIQQSAVDKARDAYFSQFQLGNRSLLDLLDTENEYFETSRAKVQAETDHASAKARTLASIGRLTQAVGVMRQGLPALEAWLPANWTAPYCPVAEGEALALNTFDSDGDGVPDNRDACPGTPPGTVVDSLGCKRGQKVVLQGVNFAKNSADLTTGSTGILDHVVRVLKDNPTTRIEIAGHTDAATGSEDFNVALSARRAKSVERYLVDNGVPAHQVRSRGWGPWKPIASNETREGQARNRRVEFRVLEPEEY